MAASMKHIPLVSNNGCSIPLCQVLPPVHSCSPLEVFTGSTTHTLFQSMTEKSCGSMRHYPRQHRNSSLHLRRLPFITTYSFFFSPWLEESRKSTGALSEAASQVLLASQEMAPVPRRSLKPGETPTMPMTPPYEERALDRHGTFTVQNRKPCVLIREEWTLRRVLARPWKYDPGPVPPGSPCDTRRQPSTTPRTPPLLHLPHVISQCGKNLLEHLRLSAVNALLPPTPLLFS